MKRYKASLLVFATISDAESDTVLRSYRATNTVIVEPEQVDLATSSLINSLDVAKKSIEEMGVNLHGHK